MMYWHDHDIDQETLTMAKMDGTEAEQFKVFINHPHIRGLSYSKDLHQLFWISMDTNIQTWDFKTKSLSDAYVSKKPLRSLDVSTSNSRIFFSIFNSPNSQIVELKPLRNNETKILIKNLKGSVDGLKVHDSNDQEGSR